MCTVIINVLDLMHLMLSPSISYLYSIEFYDFADSIQERMKHQIRGCNSGPTGHRFLDNSIIHFLSFIVRTGPFSKCENRSDSQIGCQVRTWAVLTFNMVLLIADIFGSHWEPSRKPSWKPTSVFSQRVRTAQHWWAPWEEAFP